MARRVKVTVDKSLCAGSQSCTYSAPAVFSMGEDGASQTAQGEADFDESIVEAGVNCPTGAISVVAADTGEDLLT